MGFGNWVESILYHEPGKPWGGWWEILFWVAVLVFQGCMIAFAAWRLAERHTDATGSSVLVPVKQKDADRSSGSSSSVSFLSRRRPAGISPT